MTGKRRRGKDDPPPRPGPRSGGGGRRRAEPDKRRARSTSPSTPPLADRLGIPAQPTRAGVPGPSSPQTVIPSRRTRRDIRAEKRQRRQGRRRGFGRGAIAAVVVIAIIAAVAVAIGVKKSNHGTTPVAAPPTTLLFSVAGADGSAIESALLAHDPATDQGVELLLPTRVLIEVCGYGDQRLGDVLGLPGGVALSRDAVSNLLGGVTVGGSWVLSTQQLAALVNAVGGITVDVDTNVEKTSGGRRVVLIQQGPNQHLDGARAVAFATYQPPGEDASANLVRLQEVLDGVLSGLPTGATGIRGVVAALGPEGGSTLGPAGLTTFLGALAADARANAVLPTDLPVQKIDAGGAPSYRVDQQLTADFVDANLARALPASANASHARVFIQNGVGTPGLVATACKKITAAGYDFAGSGNAPKFGFVTSKVLIFDNSVASAQLGDDVAQTLGLPKSDVAVSPAAQGTADVLVILGKDYKP